MTMGTRFLTFQLYTAGKTLKLLNPLSLFGMFGTGVTYAHSSPALLPPLKSSLQLTFHERSASVIWGSLLLPISVTHCWLPAATKHLCRSHLSVASSLPVGSSSVAAVLNSVNWNCSKEQKRASPLPRWPTLWSVYLSQQIYFLSIKKKKNRNNHPHFLFLFILSSFSCFPLRNKVREER